MRSFDIIASLERFISAWQVIIGNVMQMLG